MRSRRVTLLTNPAAGHGRAGGIAERAVAHFQQRGVDVVHIVGADEAQSRELARRAIASHAADAFVVAGGDGVIGIALQVLANSGIPLGVIPAGTGNDHARTYDIPRDNPEAAVDVVLDGWVRPIDLGRYTGDDGTDRWFGTVLASGFDALVSDRVNRMRWPSGRARYLIAMFAEMARLRRLPYTLTFDEHAPVHVEANLVAFGNTRSYGGGMLITPGADPSDGLLDVSLIAGTRRRMVLLFPTVFKGTHISLPEVKTFRAQRVRVDAPGNAYADGELLGPLPGVVSVVPAAGRLLVPRPA